MAANGGGSNGGYAGGYGGSFGAAMTASAKPSERPLGERAGAQPADAIKDVTSASFRQDVLAESQRQPVLVDFWAPWCGPCKQLAPALEKVAREAAGKIKLVKMNIDEHPDVAGQMGIQSIPAVIAFQKGQPIDGFMGALPESRIRQFVERLVGPIGDATAEILAEAEKLAAAGDAAGAADLYAGLLQKDPADQKALGGLAKLYVDMGELEQAREILAALAPDAKEQAPVAAARAALELAEQAASLGDLAPLMAKVEADPQDHQARFDLAVALNAANKRDEAADQLLAVIRKERAWNDEAARKQLLQFFEAWGPMDAATVAARRKLSAALFA
ncbi:MAG: thioredoxin [Rhodoblastus sp.]|nr:MAG: thioredoxin [Rhodoblastus sp.]